MPSHDEPSNLHEAALEVGERQNEIHAIEQDIAEVEQEYQNSLAEAARQDAYADKYEGQNRSKPARRDAAAKRRGAENRRRLALDRISKRAKIAAAGLAAAIVLLAAYGAGGNPSADEAAAGAVEVGVSDGNGRADRSDAPVDTQDAPTQTDDATTSNDDTQDTPAQTADATTSNDDSDDTPAQTGDAATPGDDTQDTPAQTADATTPGDDTQDTPAQTADATTPGDDRTGIAVTVLDTFGPKGLRVVPAPGVIVRVEDDEGDTIAEATTPNDHDGVFLRVAPGSYRVRLDIGDYVPAIPPSCGDGYVIDVIVTSGERLQLRASVYTTNVADNGNSIGTSESNCITIVDPAAGE